VPRVYGLVGPAVSPPDVLRGRGRIFPAPARGTRTPSCIPLPPDSGEERRAVCPRDVPGPPLAANDRHHQQPVNLKPARAPGPRATHRNTRAPSRLSASACERASPIAAPISRAEVAADCVRAKSPSQNDRTDCLAKARACPGEGSGAAAPRLCSVAVTPSASRPRTRQYSPSAPTMYYGQGIVWRPGAAVVDGRPAGWVSHRRDRRGRPQCPKLSVGALGQFPEIGTVPVRHRDAHARRGQGGGRAAGCGARCPGGLAARADRVRLGPRLVCLCAGLHIPNAVVIANPAL